MQYMKKYIKNIVPATFMMLLWGQPHVSETKM